MSLDPHTHPNSINYNINYTFASSSTILLYLSRKTRPELNPAPHKTYPSSNRNDDDNDLAQDPPPSHPRM